MEAQCDMKKAPWIMPEMCTGCGACAELCPMGLIAMSRREKDDVCLNIPWIEQPDLCTGCGKCAGACFFGGLMMTSYRKEAIARFKTYYQKDGIS